MATSGKKSKKTKDNKKNKDAADVGNGSDSSDHAPGFNKSRSGNDLRTMSQNKYSKERKSLQ